MIKDDKVDIKVYNKNISYYKNINKEVKVNDILTINIKDLPIYSKVKILVSCDICGDEKHIRYCDYKKITKNLTDKYYCQKCKTIKTRKTNLEKYGVENVFQIDDIKEKIKKNNLEKYGFEYYSKTEEYNVKTKKTCLFKYGVEHHLQNKDILNKLKKSNLEKYGVEYSLQNNEIKLKIIDTNIKKYGVDVPLKSQIIIDKLIQTNQERYNNNSPLQNDEIRKKSLETLMNNYGVFNPMKSKEIKERSQITKIDNILLKYQDLNILKIDYDNKNYIFMCDCGENHEFKISTSSLYNRLKIKTKLCTVCNSINSYNNSGFQIELSDFIKNNYHAKINLNDRDIINPNEIDIYLPDLRIGFEFNGIYWHNEIYKSKNYHILKTNESEKNNIQLIHIYEDDWLYKQDIVKSRILNLLGKSKSIFARKCEIKEINDSKLIRNFLDENHLQGFVGSKIKIGLFYEKELISLMIFGSYRKNMGLKSKENSYELLRFCNKLNTNVVGGASRLFKHFIKNYNPVEITSYADRSWSTGDLYKKLGFKMVHKTQPNYYYIIDGVRNCRFNFRKDKLIKEGFDKSKTEHQIMLDRKIYRIYDSGSLKFIFNIK